MGWHLPTRKRVRGYSKIKKEFDDLYGLSNDIDVGGE
jgi:hypothetical protein